MLYLLNLLDLNEDNGSSLGSFIIEVKYAVASSFIFYVNLIYIFLNFKIKNKINSFIRSLMIIGIIFGHFCGVFYGVFLGDVFWGLDGMDDFIIGLLIKIIKE